MINYINNVYYNVHVDEQSSNEQDGLGIVYDDKAIDNLLDRSQEAPEEKGPLEDNLLANQYLGQFKVTYHEENEEILVY